MEFGGHYIYYVIIHDLSCYSLCKVPAIAVSADILSIILTERPKYSIKFLSLILAL